MTLDATQARTLAAIVNALPTASDAAHGCGNVTFIITLTFASTPKIVVTDSACGVGLDAGDAQVALADSGVLQDALNQLLGLPPISPHSSAPPVAMNSPGVEPEHHAFPVYAARLVAIDGHARGVAEVRLPAAAQCRARPRVGAGDEGRRPAVHLPGRRVLRTGGARHPVKELRVPSRNRDGVLHSAKPGRTAGGRLAGR